MNQDKQTEALRTKTLLEIIGLGLDKWPERAEYAMQSEITGEVFFYGKNLGDGHDFTCAEIAADAANDECVYKMQWEGFRAGLEAFNTRVQELEAELAAVKAAHAGNLADVVQTVFDALQDKIDATGPIAKSNLQLYVNMLRDAFVADLAAPQAQDVQDAETLHLARVAVSESEGCSFPQDWMEAAIKVCKSVIAASAKGGE